MLAYSTPVKDIRKNSNFKKTPNTIETIATSDSLHSPYSPYAPFSGRKTILKLISNSNSIGTLWTVELTRLKQSGSYFEAIECLRRIRELLDEIDSQDRVKFCKADYDNATKCLKKNKYVWSTDLFKEITNITIKYFTICNFNKLPTEVIQYILMFLSTDNFAPIMSICSEWNAIGRSDQIWCYFYQQKFLLNNPNSFKTPVKATTFLKSFQTRLNDPQIGDIVEVAWRGKFRLETQDIYQGLAWWVAEVVDKHSNQSEYKIRYPGWESRWDEWVPRSRLRWTVTKNVLVSIHVNDIVELWCCGANVPGAWLESKVKKVRNDKYSIGKVLSSGTLWVERDRLRLVRRAGDVMDDSSDTSRESMLLLNRHPTNVFLRSLSRRMRMRRVSTAATNPTNNVYNHYNNLYDDSSSQQSFCSIM